MIKENEDIPLETGKRYWKSLDDYSDSPQFREWLEREFPQGASILEDVQRRGFMKLMTASFGLAGLGLSSCRRPEHAILPYGKSPEELIPGVPNYYATSMPSSCGFLPLIAESHQGRPTKIEGNPSYLPYGGSTDIYAQASVLDLYDPDRAKGSFLKETIKFGAESSSRWKKIPSKEAISEIKNWVKDGKVAVLADSSFSLARKKLSDELQTKGVIWSEYDSLSSHTIERQLGMALGLNRSVRTLPKLQKVSRLLSLDCDFMGREPFSLGNSRTFMSGRKVHKPADAHKMNRLYSVEADLTITGGVADHRLRLESSKFVAFSALLASEVLKLRKSKDQALIDHLAVLGKPSSSHLEWIRECAKDLCSKPNRSVVLAGHHLPVEVHLATLAINQSLGCIGKSIDYLSVEDSSATPLESLISSLDKGEVDSMIFLGGNPIHATSGFVNWSDLLGKVTHSARIGFPWTNHRKFAIFTLVNPTFWNVGIWVKLGTKPPSFPRNLFWPRFSTPYQIWSAFSALMIRIKARTISSKTCLKKTSSHPMTSWISCVWAFKRQPPLRLPKRPTRRRLLWHLIMRAKSQQRVASRSCLYPTSMPWTEDSPTMVGCRNVRIPLPN